MSTEQDDERLAAWLDGAMPPEEAAAFAAEVARDAALAAQAEAWRTHDRKIAAALDAAERPIDAALLQRLGLAAASQAANDNPHRPGLRWLAAGSALAASVVAALLLTMRAPAPADPLSGALDRTASLASAQLADGRTITPTLTVRAADGRWCREYREAADIALACRAGGRWNVEARAKANGAAAPGTIALAGGADPAPLDAAYRQLKASDPVGAAEEAKLLASHWR
ncbi:MAG: hypothetical protein ACKVOL_02250 [Novosphingobium sp.]